MNALVVLGLTFAITACSSGSNEQPGSKASPTSSGARDAPGATASAASATPREVMSAEPEPQKSARASSAHFEKDELDECVDIELTSDEVVNPKELAALTKATPLSEPCGASFKGRTVLATCAVAADLPKDAGRPSTLTMTSHYYRFASVVDSDGFMQDCMKAGGKWDALARDSEQFKEAERQWRRRAQRGAGEKPR